MASIKYVPKNQRQGGKRRLERFHGAFTGGFSAGHFNTVGTEEGWKPKTNIEEGQRMEDYMDEQDHNEWGGPQGVRQDFQGRHFSTKPQQVGTGSDLEQTLFGSQDLIPSNIGSRLLRKLGWKEGSSYAFVPGDGASAAREHSNEEDEGNARVLSSRRLRKIRIQQTNMKIPSPKMDTVGLGFDAHKDAPEFAAFLAKRKRKAQERAQGNHRSVYRLSTVLDDPKSSQITENSSHFKSDHNYESYELVEDFVGTRSVGGFALRDDEDDAFDDHTGQNLTRVSEKVILDKDQYNTVIEDPVSDEDNDDAEDNARRTADVQDLSMGFSAFADINGQPAQTWESTKIALTSDGRPPLTGFVLGGERDGVTTHFRGPDLPTHFEERLHVFQDDEHPLVWKALTRAVQLEHDDARKEAAMKGALASRRVHKKAGSKQNIYTPLAGSAFASLASAMKDRFTSSSANTGESHHESALPAGLTSPDAIPRASPQSLHNNEKHRNLSLVQTTQSFAPAPLLCKRFGVRAPAISSTAIVPKDDALQSQEQSFFIDKVLTAAKSAKSNQIGPEAANENWQHTDILVNRPPMAVYESIFGGVQEEEKLNSDDDDDEEESTHGNQEVLTREQGQPSPLLPTSKKYVRRETLKSERNELSRISRQDKESTEGHRHSDDYLSSDGSGKESKATKRYSEQKKRRKKENKKKEKRKRRKRERRDSYDSDSGEDRRHERRASSQRDSKRNKKVRKDH
jgi:G patch domain-containing protein 1